MAAVLSARPARPAISTARWDAIIVALAFTHAAMLLAWPSVLLIALGLWWNANTVAHNFIHRPMMRSRAGRALFSCFLSLLLGLPQSLWRARHLAHHAGTAARIKPHRLMIVETLLVIAFWSLLAFNAPTLMLTVWLPGWLLGLGLCQLQGHYEHARGTVSHYGRIYNWLFFNDGYHVEHHAQPGMHWTELPRRRSHEVEESRWPPVLRWMESIDRVNPCAALCALERLVRRSPRLQRFVIDRHEWAFRRLLANPDERIGVIGIIGGGLFPRTALVLKRICPQARLVLIDLDAAHLEMARERLGGTVDYVCERFERANPEALDAIVVPLAFVGDRAALYSHPPARVVFVHDWIWRRRGRSTVVSWLLLKRLNMVLS